MTTEEHKPRPPVFWLNYPGNIVESFDMERPYGPNTLREFLWPVTVEYYAEANKTRVGFSLQAPASYLERMGARSV